MKLTIILVLLFAACTGGGGGGGGADADGSCPAGASRPGPYTARVSIIDETSARGIFDPSIEYPDGADAGLMTYTAVPDEAHVHPAIAASIDHGATWHRIGDVAAARPITIDTDDDEVCGADSCTGTWVHESSSLVVDPYDPDVSRRLKVFVHSYFFGATRWLRLGYLAMYTATEPEGPWTETKLFGWDSPSSISSTGVVYNVQTDPALAGLHDCFIVGEPGASVRPDGTIDLALACPVITGSTDTIEVRLVRSTDHGHTWSVAGTLLDPDDATTLGSTGRQINGADLFFAAGAYHLIVTPDGPVDTPDGEDVGYRGCVVVKIEDLDQAKVARCDGRPVVEAAYLGEPRVFTGACSADVGDTVDGMLIPVPDFSASDPYRIWGAGGPILP